MSLTTILNSAAAGIANTDYKIGLTNSNLANASNPNYTTKSATSSVISPMLALSTSTVTRAADSYLTQAVVSTSSESARDQAISASLANYDTALGSTSDGTDISSQMSALQSALGALSAGGATTSERASVGTAAQTVANGIRNLSSQIQGLRTQANTDIAATVTDINTATAQIAALNKQIVSISASGGDVTNLEDQRDAALQSLSQDIGLTYYVTPDNQMQVYAAGGAQLVGSAASTLSYSAASGLTSANSYPATIPGIVLNGQDITTSISTGKLAGLITLRDQTYPQEQAELNAYAGALITTANAVSNSGTAYPPPSTLTGSTTVNASDAFSAMGTLRVAVTNSSGAVVSSQDINLSGISTVSALVTALNGVTGVTASINAQGKLTISATAPNGVALSDMPGTGSQAMVAPNGTGVSAYFGLNNLFSGTDASNIALNPIIAASPSALPTGALSTAGTLNPGQVAIASADTTVSDALNQALSKAVNIPAAGNVPAQSTSLQSYATNFVASAATMISTASSQASTSSATFTAAQTRLQNLTSVNTDQEMANLQSFQQQYEANAQVISMVRSLFTSLMTMMQA